MHTRRAVKRRPLSKLLLVSFVFCILCCVFVFVFYFNPAFGLRLSLIKLSWVEQLALLVQYVARNIVSQLQIHRCVQMIMLSSLLFVVVVNAGCDKAIHWCIEVCAVNCTVDCASQLSHSVHHRSDSQRSIPKFYAEYPSCQNPPSLPGLVGTGPQCAVLHNVIVVPRYRRDSHRPSRL